MRFASLGSGSAGNALIVEHGGTYVLLDCGFSVKETSARLVRLGVSPDQLSGILVTHEHDDHAAGAFRLASKYRLPVFLSHGTRAALNPIVEGGHLHIIDGHVAFGIGNLEIHPYTVPHDAREPLQFVISSGSHRLGVLTDTGTTTPHIEMMLSGCHALVLECNHDTQLLNQSSYPWSLKQRISGRLGHLDNNAAAKILSRLNNHFLQHIIAAHLSEQNNRPELAQAALSEVLNCENNWIGIADQSLGFDWRSIN